MKSIVLCRVEVVLSAVLFCSACAPLATQPENTAGVEPAEDAGATTSSWSAAEREGSSPSGGLVPPLSAAEPHRGPEAAASLARKARDEQRVGDYDAAAATLERALRLDPRNPDLWHQLAAIHLDQRHWRQAAEFATRSNSFAAADKSLQARNWRLIARVREMTGDPQGATHAYSQAARLERE